MLLRSLARAVWRQDSRLGNILWQRHPWLRSFFSVDPSSSSVVLASPDAFARAHSDLQLQEARAETERLQRAERASRAQGRQARLRSQARALRRRAQIWSPFNRRGYLA
eukprot:7659244-Pyramimonas_sp.AAC.1